MDWTSIIPQVVGAFLGALAAYMAIREDIAMLKAQSAAHALMIAEVKAHLSMTNQRVDRVIESGN